MKSNDSFLRYLASKRTVDDRAINQTTWIKLLQYLGEASKDRTIRVLEIGAGIGTMVERLASATELPSMIYTAVDINREAIDMAGKRLECLPNWIELHLETADVFDFITRNQGKATWDLVIAHAFLDLVNISEAIPEIFSLLEPEGHFYFTLNFDGATVLEPSIDPDFDAKIENLYHKTMDERITQGLPSGDSQTGRHLFTHLAEAGADILSAGSSDWVVFAGKQGYPEDEAYFLHFIIDTIQGALENRNEVDQHQFRNWISQRHAQIDRNELVYIARQLDFFGKRLTTQ